MAEIDSLPNVRLERASVFYRTKPIGGAGDQGDYLNAAAAVSTTVPPLAFLELLRRIETRHGRLPADRWAARTLDIDLLLYGNEVIESPALTLPHLRMSYRRFVLEPAAEIAPKTIHPIIGWSLDRLLLHLNSASDEAVLLSPSESRRRQFADAIRQRFAVEIGDSPSFKTAAQLWPPAYSTWLTIKRADGEHPRAPAKTRGLPYAAAAFPKLTVLLDADHHSPHPQNIEWSGIVRQPGRGPTLRLQATQQPVAQAEVIAAFESVWPDLGQPSADRLE